MRAIDAGTSWGATLRDREAEFRVWAPAAERLRLWLNGVEHAMEAEDGWWRAVLPASDGDRYCFVLDDGSVAADPAARAMAGGLRGEAVLVDLKTYRWRHPEWTGRPWAEAVISEIHVGTFTEAGTFRATIEQLPAIAEAGITAVELMPVAQFEGARGWGYDGVLLYAPHEVYGTPDDLRTLIDAAHGLGLMVFLDVVYNHFGPEGNPLPRLAPEFFHGGRHTPWGVAIAYERPAVRQFFIDNALMWLGEYRFDGLRFDAADHIRDEAEESILVEMAREIRAAFPDREVHLATEDNRNIVGLHPWEEGRPRLHTAEWNDDLHNVAHVIATGETEGYYVDFAEQHWEKYARALAEGFAYQGEVARYHDGEPRGEPSAGQPPLAFIDFLQNHDQVGNRAFGERLTTLASGPMLRGLTAMLLLSPHVPLLFMGQEWGETRPFVYFTDFEGELAQAVRDGRRLEFGRFSAFRDAAARATIPDPNDPDSFAASRIDWTARDSAAGRDWLEFTRGLLSVRRREIVPHLERAPGHGGRVLVADRGLVAVDWRLDGATLRLRANLAEDERVTPEAAGRVIWGGAGGPLPGFGVRATLDAG